MTDAKYVILSLEKAALALNQAEVTHMNAVLEYAVAENGFEKAKTHLIFDGVEGKNAEQRDAHVCVILSLFPYEV